MVDVSSKPEHMYAYTPPTKRTAYGPDTNSMDWNSGSAAKREASLNSSFKALGEKSDDTVGDIRRYEAEKAITNTGRLRNIQEMLTPTPGRGTTEDPKAGRGG